jgi:DNA processing protein
LTGVDDILNELNYLGGMRPQPIPAKYENGSGALPAAGLGENEAIIMDCFRGGALLTPDALSGLTGLPVAELSSTLMMLELKKMVAKRADGTFEART